MGARRVWIVAVALIVASGAVVVAGHPGSATGSTSEARPVPTEPEALYRCLAASGAFAFGNLRMDARDYHGELLGDVEIVPTAGGAPSRRPDATPLERDLVLGAFDACLLPMAFVDADSATGRGALLGLYQYQVTRYWPCLRAHGMDPGLVPAVGQYLSRSAAPRLVPFQDGFRGSARQVRIATRACAFAGGGAASG